MKGDFILLGITGAAILIVPMAVTLMSGSLTIPQSNLTVPSATQSKPSSESWQETSIPSGQPTLVLPEAVTAEASSAAPPEMSHSSSAAKPQGKERESSGKRYKNNITSFKILNRSSGKVEQVSLEDYVRGAIAAEMPASFHTEALTAQGVAALTYACCHAEEQRSNPDPLLLGADFSADPNNREGYMTEKGAKKFYGENWRYNWERVCNAADEARHWIILADGKPIAAAYHAISAGTTEAAENIWDAPMAGLKPVDSSWDILARDYKSTVILTQSEIKEKLKGEEVTLLPNPDTWFSVEETSPSGYVTQVRVGNRTMTGNQLRNLLGLRSSSFHIERQGRSFMFLVTGYGHGAGLSQNGADYMARQGKSFIDILRHYYRDTNLVQLYE